MPPEDWQWALAYLEVMVCLTVWLFVVYVRAWRLTVRWVALQKALATEVRLVAGLDAVVPSPSRWARARARRLARQIEVVEVESMRLPDPAPDVSLLHEPLPRHQLWDFSGSIRLRVPKRKAASRG